MKVKFTTNLDKETLKQIKVRAIEENKNVNEIIEEQLTKYLKEEKSVNNIEFKDLQNEYEEICYHLSENENKKGYHIIEYYDENNFTGDPIFLDTLEEVENTLIRMKFNKGRISEDEFHNKYDFELDRD